MSVSKAAVLSGSGESATGTTISRWRKLYSTPLLVFVVTRCCLALLAWGAPRLLAGPGIRDNGSVLPGSDVVTHIAPWAAPWFRFDAQWYIELAQHGYHWGSLGVANTNFMPLYPALIRLFTPLALGSAWLSALLVANVASLLAFVLLWRWARTRWDEKIALRALLLVAVFPFSFFLITPYAESLFLALAVATFILADEGRWEAAAVTAGLSTITRPVGAAVVLALIVMAWQRAGRRQQLQSVLAIAPLLLFAGYLGIAFGHPFGFLTYHSQGWVPPHGSLLTTIGEQFHTRLTPFDRVDAALAVLFLGSGLFAWKRLGAGYGVYVLAGCLMPLVHGLVSMDRYVIVLFPAMAIWASTERRFVGASIFAASAFGLVLATAMFAAGYTLI